MFVALVLGSTSAFASPAITLTDANTKANPLTYSAGPWFLPSSQLDCVSTPQPTCDDTTLTVNVSPATAQTMRVVVRIDWGAPTQADYDLFVKQGSNTIASSASTTDPEIARFAPVNGQYTINVAAYQPYGQSFNASVYLEPKTSLPPPALGAAARYHVFVPPAGLRFNEGEPSIGANWKTGRTVVGNTTQALFIDWDDSTSPATDSWANRPPFTNLISFDPILFTDRETGHTVVSQLVSDVVAFTAGCSLSSVTDDDGLTWVPAEGCGPPSGADHQGVGGGPYHAPVPNLPSPAPHAVYYCAQLVGGGYAGGNAFCSRSDDGGITYNPGIPVYTSECGGLHGHPRVAPDGTVYLPNKNCAGNGDLAQGFAVSVDNGLTWSIRTVPNVSPGESDPSVATGLNNTGKPASQASNTVYLGMCSGDGEAIVGVSRDQGATWTSVKNVGAAAGIKNCVFPEMIAGDDDRAAMMFLGTTTAGAYQSADFTGEWHVYVATTYDAGQTWGLYDATPNDPVQIGAVCQQGIACQGHRNLLDFNDISLDKRGRPVFIYADGCVAPGCMPGSSPSTSNKALQTVGRQSGGKTLFSQYDSQVATLPGAPKVLSASRSGSTVSVKWLEPDNGGAALTAYRVYRGTVPGQEKLIATVGASKPEYLDTTAAEATSYFYKVSAVNANGEGAQSPEMGISGQEAVESVCAAPGLTLGTDASGDEVFKAGPLGPHTDLESLKLAEPFTTVSDKFVQFTLKVANLAEPVQRSTIWKVSFVVNDTTGTARTLFVAMDTTDAAELSPVFNYGWNNDGTDTGQGADYVTGAYNADGTITLKLKTGTINFTTLTGDPAFSAKIDKGTTLSNIVASTQVQVGATVAGTGGGLLETSDSIDLPASHTLKSNYFCRPNHAPVAVLTATPIAGFSPLTVAFDASGSSDQDADALTTFAFDFGDGSDMQIGSSATASHQYTTAGNYVASVVVTDERDASSVDGGTQAITVKPPLKAVADAYTVKVGGTGIVLRPLVNDRTAAGTATITRKTAPDQGGTLAIGSDHKSLVYAPKAGFVGKETFKYTIAAGSATSTALVTVTVRANRAPVATADSFTVAKNSTGVTLNVLQNDKDADAANTPKDTLHVSTVGATNHGGTVSIPTTKTAVRYKPATGFAGTETFSYTIVDDSGAKSTATVTVTVQ